MRRYYAESKFFVWLRKKLHVAKPYALPWGGWEIWNKETKANQRIAYFLTETLPDWLEKPAEWFIDPIYDATYYLRNRFVTKTHYLHTDLAPGKWHEFETRLLHGAFTTFVDFVEIEKAWMCVAWDTEAREKYKTPWWRDNWLFRWKRWRCPEAGIHHLKWEMSLADITHQRESAVETMFLYTWWKEVRANRKDEWEETGLRDFWNNMETKYGEDWLGLGKRSKMNKAERDEYQRLTDACHALEEEREEEDEEMLMRLVKLRRSLWT